MKKISVILLICMIFSLFCSCEQEIAQSSEKTNNEESSYSQNSESENETSSADIIENEQSSNVSIEVSYAGSSSRKPIRPLSSSQGLSSSSEQVITGNSVTFVSSTAESSKTSQTSSTSPVSDVEIENITPIREEDYYGYVELQREGTEAEKKAYQVLKTQIGNYQKKIVIDFDITKKELERAYYYYKDDYPEHFWRGNKLFFKGQDDKITTLILSDMICGGDAEKIKNLDNEMKIAANKVVENIKSSMTEYEREEYLHNYIINNCRYEDTGYSHTLYGALVKGSAVCEGYAYAFQYLMRRAGVQCIVVRGDLKTGNGAPESHAWNMVNLDGEYYHVDITSDDPVTTDQNGNRKDVLKFSYFNVGDEEIKKDHTICGNFYTIPKANGSKYNYFEINKLKFKKFDVDSFAKAYAHAAKKGYKRVYIKFEKLDSNEFANFISANLLRICDKANKLLEKKQIKAGNTISYVIDRELNIVNIELNYV